MSAWWGGCWLVRTWRRITGQLAEEESRRREEELTRAVTRGTLRRDIRVAESDAMAKLRMAAKMEDSGEHDLAEKLRLEASVKEEYVEELRRTPQEELGDWMEGLVPDVGGREGHGED